MRKAPPPPPDPNLPDQLNRRAAELLADGEWHSYEKVLRDLMRLVPPGIAARRSERDRRYSVANGERPVGQVGPRKRPRPASEIVRTGARSIVREVFRGGGKNLGAYEVKGDQIRLRYLPRVVRGDLARAQTTRPVLEDLAATFARGGLDEAVEEVRLAAHRQGFHLSPCPKNCRLGGPMPS